MLAAAASPWTWEMRNAKLVFDLSSAGHWSRLPVCQVTVGTLERIAGHFVNMWPWSSGGAVGHTGSGPSGPITHRSHARKWAIITVIKILEFLSRFHNSDNSLPTLPSPVWFLVDVDGLFFTKAFSPPRLRDIRSYVLFQHPIILSLDYDGPIWNSKVKQYRNL